MRNYLIEQDSSEKEKSIEIERFILNLMRDSKRSVIYATEIAKYYNFLEIMHYMDSLMERGDKSPIDWSTPSHSQEEDPRFWRENWDRFIPIRGMCVYYFYARHSSKDGAIPVKPHDGKIQCNPDLIEIQVRKLEFSYSDYEIEVKASPECAKEVYNAIVNLDPTGQPIPENAEADIYRQLSKNIFAEQILADLESIKVAKLLANHPQRYKRELGLEKIQFNLNVMGKFLTRALNEGNARDEAIFMYRAKLYRKGLQEVKAIMQKREKQRK